MNKTQYEPRPMPKAMAEELTEDWEKGDIVCQFCGKVLINVTWMVRPRAVNEALHDHRLQSPICTPNEN